MFEVDACKSLLISVGKHYFSLLLKLIDKIKKEKTYLPTAKITQN